MHITEQHLTIIHCKINPDAKKICPCAVRCKYAWESRSFEMKQVNGEQACVNYTSWLSFICCDWQNNVNSNKNDSSISEDVAGIWQSAKQLPILSYFILTMNVVGGNW